MDGPKSFLEIQQEQQSQEYDKRYNRGGFRGGGSRNSNHNRGDRGSNHNRGDRGSNHNRGDRGSNGGQYNSNSSRYNKHPDRSNLPVEGGVVCSLKESFGFIHCAERDDEIFFHYSEVRSCHPADLQVDDEVEFRVTSSSKDAGKLAAYEVNRVPTGTVIWEIEEEVGKKYQGFVERPIRNERGGNGPPMDGTIRIVDDQEGENSSSASNGKNKDESNDHMQEKEKSNNYNNATTNSNAERIRFRGIDCPPTGRLGRGDLLEFNIFIERRTNTKYARFITLVQSERDRIREEKEKNLLANATLEQGVITSLKADYGFLRSNRRRDEVYFHFSNIDWGENDDRNILQVGQDTEFLVVSEDGPKPRVSARNVTMQPRGSVQFHQQIATGVTGIVSRCPHAAEIVSKEKWGCIQLSEPIEVDAGQGEKKMVREVFLRPRNSPGGVYTIPGRGASSSFGLWIRDGDKLLFDVVQELVDNTCYAEPTLCLESGGEQSKDINPAVRLIELSLAGRAEGTVHTLKEAYGFLHFAERPVDVHFKISEILPDQLQSDLRRNMGLEDGQYPLAPGTEVHFDLSVQGSAPALNSRSRNNKQDRENLKGQRILFLPPNTVIAKKVLATNVQGIITKQDPNQPYAGALELQTELEHMTFEEKHPLVAKMIDDFLNNKSRPSLVFPDLQSPKEDNIVIDMIDLKAKKDLDWSHIPVAGESLYQGRFCIRRAETEIGNANTTLSPGMNPEQSTDEHELTEGELTHTDDEHNGSTPAKKSKKRKKKKKKSKAIKIVRYDRGSLEKNTKEDMPPGIGDVVTFDVAEIRRTGKVMIQNLVVIERKAFDPNDVTTGDAGTGIVKEVVSQRQFGFISVLDENATKRELLFFPFKNVIAPESTNNNPSTPQKSSVVLKKGDEVRFNIGVEKNGKRIALNVQSLPKGTIPSKADKNACRGYILVEPSHTEIGVTPSRNSKSRSRSITPPKKGGRWDNVKEDGIKMSTPAGTSKNDGFILLLEDPTNVFGKRTQQQDDKQNGENSENSEEKDNVEKSNKPQIISAVGTHIPYKNGAMALHGTGAPSHDDSSTNPRRGDLVSFLKAKSSNGVREIRIISRATATLVRGILQNIDKAGHATFVSTDDSKQEYKVDLTEVVGCDPFVLKDCEPVEGILHEDKIHGICRTADLYLASKVNTKKHKERPKLNLTVKKDRGGKIMAQSMMAKGPDGTNGFPKGWTSRSSKYDKIEEKSNKSANGSNELPPVIATPSKTTLSADAPEFVIK